MHRMPGKDRLEYPIGKVLYETAGWIQNPRFSPDGTRSPSSTIPGTPTAARWRSSIWPGRKPTSRRVGRPSRAWRGRRTAAKSGSRRRARGSSAGSSRVTPGGKLRLIRTMQGTPALLDLVGRRGADHGRRLPSSTLAFLPGQAEAKDLTWFDWTNDRGLSPDGSHALRRVGRGGGRQRRRYLRPTDGRAAVRLGDGVGLALSPDSAWALTRPFRTSAFVLVPVKAGQPQAFPPDDFGTTAYGAFLPDGRRFVFEANAPGQGARLYVQALSGGSERSAKKGSTTARLFISPDAHWIAAVGPDRGCISTRSAGGSRGFWRHGRGLSRRMDGRRKGPLRLAAGFPARVDLIDIASGRRTQVRGPRRQRPRRADSATRPGHTGRRRMSSSASSESSRLSTGCGI